MKIVECKTARDDSEGFNNTISKTNKAEASSKLKSDLKFYSKVEKIMYLDREVVKCESYFYLLYDKRTRKGWCAIYINVFHNNKTLSRKPRKFNR